ncbi:GFA family protein [Hydrocarboniphaga sp.]|uniref:GFA family protein n=1 Tax=Hydrocarboniphaga sp. TaxID=2033016 RepID=UPI002630B1A0|nr:GFA family protein [Hydrocarboniphaga sp.]
MKHKGSCHCGQIAFEVEGEFDRAMECNCSHCSRKGYLLSFVPRAQLEIKTNVGVSTYTFNRHVIEHQFCSNCGCAPYGFGKDSKGRETAAINLRCLEGIDLGALKRTAVDGRSF